jgi:hypothetical protein
LFRISKSLPSSPRPSKNHLTCLPTHAIIHPPRQSGIDELKQQVAKEQARRNSERAAERAKRAALKCMLEGQMKDNAVRQVAGRGGLRGGLWGGLRRAGLQPTNQLQPTDQPIPVQVVQPMSETEKLINSQVGGQARGGGGRQRATGWPNPAGYR